MELTLDADVRNALEARKGDWLSIAKQARVSHSWLSKFVNGHIANPGFGTLKRLHQHLIVDAAAVTADPPAPASADAAQAAA